MVLIDKIFSNSISLLSIKISLRSISSILLTVHGTVMIAPPSFLPSGRKKVSSTAVSFCGLSLISRRIRLIFFFFASSSSGLVSVSLAVYSISSSRPTNAANGANCAARAERVICGLLVETRWGRSIISSYFPLMPYDLRFVGSFQAPLRLPQGSFPL